MMRSTNDLILAYLSAAGLGAKCAVIAADADVLLTEEVERFVVKADVAGHSAPELQAALLRSCREQGIERGASHFANMLVGIWIYQADLDAKAVLLTLWGDPLLSDAAVESLAAAANQETDALGGGATALALATDRTMPVARGCSRCAGACGDGGPWRDAIL